MAENLNVGIPITSDTSGSLQTNNGIIEKYCYNNFLNNCDNYGGLYEWNEMMQYAPSDPGLIGSTQGVCPENWHLPTDEEWKILEEYIGMEQNEINSIGWRGAIEGGKLKDTGTTHWYSPNVLATNEIGWIGLPGGGRYDDFGTFHYLHTNGGWFLATEINSNQAWKRSLSYSASTIARGEGNKASAFAVRCVKNY